MRILLLIPVWFVLALLIPTAWAITRIYKTIHGFRPVICPGTGVVATVELDPAHAVAMRILGNPVQRIHACSRWPERQTCHRRCVSQFEPMA